jgi:hypothetical protein
MSVPQGTPESQPSPGRPSRTPPNIAVVVLTTLGGLFVLLTIVGYALLINAADHAESDSVGEGYGFATVLLIMPCLVGVMLLVAAAATARARNR